MKIGMIVEFLDEIVQAQKRGEAKGLTSVCSANPYVLRKTMQRSVVTGEPVLIESTCNQVNQYGGYSGMTPAAFASYVGDIAEQHGMDKDRLILGGDHIGPSVWQEESADHALMKAEVLVREYVKAGFSKFHIDTSMHLGGDNAKRPLDVDLVAQRTARLAKASEEAWGNLSNRPAPRYVIGTEVPTPGGARQPHRGERTTSPTSAEETIQATRRAFYREGQQNAWERVFALVVQPGVEFGDDFILRYDPAMAVGLTRYIEASSNLVYEAHSTDYQSLSALRGLVRDHYAILKVGPALTFAFREMVFTLSMIENELFTGPRGCDRSNIIDILEATMLRGPDYWQGYYRGTAEQQAFARKYSLSDRIRYYWTNPQVQLALTRMINNLEGIPIPLTLLSQFAPSQFAHVIQGSLKNSPIPLIMDHIDSVLQIYADACQG